jgi:hypothetical protein
VFVELTPDSSAIERFEIGGQWYDGDSEAGRAIDEAIQSKFHTSLLSAAR